MTLTFRTKLLASNISLVAAVVLLVLLQIGRSVGADMQRSLEQRLEEQAHGAALWIGEGRHPANLARRLAQVVHADIAIYDKDGRLVGVSDHGVSSPAAPSKIGDEPELVAARAGATGRDARGDMAYVAVPAEGGLVVRLALPLSDVRETLRDLHQRLAVAFGLALLAAIGLGVLAARVVTGPLRAMTDAATRIADGDYDIAPPSTSPDELGRLGRALAALATQLRAKITDLTQERDRLSAILDGMAEGVLVLDAEGIVLLANPAAGTVLGAGAALEGRPLHDVVREPRLRGVIASALQRHEAHDAEIEADGEGGRATAVYLRPLARPGAGGVVAVLRDMTRIRRLLAQRRDLVANVSHELRTPVTAIQGYAETLLQRRDGDATTRQFLEIIHRHGRRLGALVEQLLELADLEVRPPEEAVHVRVDLRATAENVAETLRRRAETEGAALELDVAPDAVALGDPAGVEQILENFVENALKYGEEGGIVRVHGGRRDGWVLLHVTNQGAGIDPRHLPHIFERFYRVDPSRSREHGGAGLGLAIVRQLADSMGGTVEVESAPFAETTFTLGLPAY